MCGGSSRRGRRGRRGIGVVGWVHREHLGDGRWSLVLRSCRDTFVEQTATPRWMDSALSMTAMTIKSAIKSDRTVSVCGARTLGEAMPRRLPSRLVRCDGEQRSRRTQTHESERDATHAQAAAQWRAKNTAPRSFSLLLRSHRRSNNSATATLFPDGAYH